MLGYSLLFGWRALETTRSAPGAAQSLYERECSFLAVFGQISIDLDFVARYDITINRRVLRNPG